MNYDTLLKNRKSWSHQSGAAIVCIVLTVTLSPLAWSEDTQRRVIEEIVVTAQKRSESVQDVPSTVNVLSGEALKEFNVMNFTDLETLTAGLTSRRTTGRSGVISLRGVPFNPNSAAEAAITVYLNQTLVDGNRVYQQMFDVERIEVLRGAQGTLAGRSSPAGSINIHTILPNLDSMEGQIRGIANDDDGLNTQAAINLPLIEGVLAVRVAGVFDESNMNGARNILTGGDTDEETTAGRISVSWQPSDTLSVDLMHQQLEYDITWTDILDGTPSGDPVLDPLGELRPLDAFDRKGASVGADETSAEFSSTTLNIEWELGNHTISSVTGYHTAESTRDFDQADGNADPGNFTRRIAMDDRDDWSQEIRIANNDADFWEYMVGAYYERSDVLFTQDNFMLRNHPLWPGSVKLFFPIVIDRFGLFTHNKFHLSDDWNLQLGLRYQEAEAERDDYMATNNGFRGLPDGTVTAQILSDENKTYDEDAITGTVSLQYALNDDVNLYGSIATGWRQGGITVTGSPLPEDVLLFDSEDSISYEFGFKGIFNDGTLRLNGAVFYQDFDDFISRVATLNIRDIDGAMKRAGVSVNSDAEVFGAELEFDSYLSENWTLGGSISYANSEFAGGGMPCNEFDDNGQPVIPEGAFVQTCDVSGQPLGTPEWTASFHTEYTMAFDGFEGYGRLLFRYVDERFHKDLDDLDAYQEAHLYIGIRSTQWDVSAFVRNLFDEEAVISGAANTQLVKGRASGYGTRSLIQERTFGVTLGYNF